MSSQPLSNRSHRYLPEEDLIELCFVVGPHCDGMRLDRFVHYRIPRLSRARIQRMLRSQSSLGGDPVRPAMRVRAGQRVRLLRPAPQEPEVPLTYGTLHEDDNLLVIDKPAGLPVHATARFHRHTLTALLRQRYEPQHVPRLIHRLDRETSGVMLLAKQPGFEVALKGALARRRVRKRYLALVEGTIEDSGRIELPIGEDPESGIRIKRRATPTGLPAATAFRTLERRGSYALVEAHPETGRQHQIRVHLSAIGCPIVGDKLYGDDPTCLLEYLETGWTESLAKRLHLERHALHAASISFEHPSSGAIVAHSAQLAADLRAFWDRLAAT
jgi:23S rRNA pseudouridine1911/1915/1917 synthase